MQVSTNVLQMVPDLKGCMSSYFYFFDFTPHFQAQISAVLITFLMAQMLDFEQK